MSWAKYHIEKLARGETVEFRPHGRSMKGKVEDGELVRVGPAENVEVDDVVLVRLNGNVLFHLVSAMQGDRYQISNNKGHVNGWVKRPAIFGKLIAFPERAERG